MVSSINSVRIWSSQAALNAFKDVSDNKMPGSSASGTSSSTLADMLFSSSSGGNDDYDYEDDKLSALIASLQRTMNGTVPDETAGDGSVGDMSSKAFMKALQEKLDGLKASPDTKAMAEAMQKALDAGTLTLTDAVAGDQITAWDITDGTQTSTGVSSVDKSDWTQFLKDRLTRDEDGKFVRSADGSYIEKATGANSYFGMVGEAYYYISWTVTAATKPAAGTTPASSTDTK